MATKRIKKQAGQKLLAKPRYWVAVGALAAYSVSSGDKQALAQGSSGNPNKGSGDDIHALPVRRYDIGPGMLGDVLLRFAGIAGLSIDPFDPRIGQVNSGGLKGSFTAEEALSRILAGTTVRFRFSENGHVLLRFEAATSSIEVTDLSAGMQLSLPKIQVPLLDLPQTASVVSQKTMNQQGDTTLRDALRNVAGISLAAGEGGAQGDNLTIRGFTARNDLFIDGMRDFGSYYRDPFNLSEVEVLQGPSSVTFGRGSTGGVVNQASKTPELNAFVSGNVQFGTDTTRRGTVDVSAPLPKLGTGTAFRLNAMGDIGNVAGRNIATNRRDGFAPSLAFGLGTPTRLTLSYFHQNEDDIPDYGLPWYFNQPAAVNRNNYYGMEGNYLRTNVNIGTAKLEHDVNSHVTVREQFRYADYQRAAVITEAQLKNITPTTPLGQVNVFRNEIAVASDETLLDNQLDAIAHVTTGRIRHTVVAGIEAGRESSDPTRFSYTAPTTSLLNPNYHQRFTSSPTVSSKVTDSATTVSGYVLDTVNLGSHLSVSGGVRYDRFDNSYRQSMGVAADLARVDAKTAWRGALVYKPKANGSIYLDAGTSFNPSAEALSLTAGSVNLAPESNRTYEAGSKWDFQSGRLQLASSIFQTVKSNARESDPTNALLVVVAGSQRVRGAQASITGRLTNRWEIMSSYAYLDSRVMSSRFYPLAVGYALANVPRNNFTFWSNHHLPGRFELGGGANYLGRRNASSTVPLDPITGLLKAVPSYWVFDAMVSRPLNEHVEWQLNGYNLANRFYYDQVHPGHVVPGVGRSLEVGFRFKF